MLADLQHEYSSQATSFQGLLSSYFRFARAFCPRFLGANDVRAVAEILAYVCFPEPATSSRSHLRASTVHWGKQTHP